MKIFKEYFSLAVILVKTAVVYFVSLINPFFQRRNWKTIRMWFEIAEKLSRFAKREKLAKNVGWLAKKFDKFTKDYSPEDTARAATEITSSKGVLEDLSIGYSKGIITGNLGSLKADYDPEDGSVKLGLKL